MKATVNLGPLGGVVEAEVSDIDLEAEEVYVGGERLNEEGASALGHEFTQRRAGRPNLDASGSGSVHVGFRVTKLVRAQLAGRAEREGVPESEVLRAALSQYLAS